MKMKISRTAFAAGRFPAAGIYMLSGKTKPAPYHTKPVMYRYAGQPLILNLATCSLSSFDCPESSSQEAAVSSAVAEFVCITCEI